jgi:hypothetical protein
VQAYGVRGGFLGGTYCIGDLAGETGGVLAVDPAGRFLVAWFGAVAAGAPSPLFVRRFEMDGTPLGDTVQVATAGPAQLNASADGQGNAALYWREGDLLRVLAVNREGVAKGPAITLSGFLGRPVSVALEDSGRLLVTWLSGGVQLGQLWQARF